MDFQSIAQLLSAAMNSGMLGGGQQQQAPQPSVPSSNGASYGLGSPVVTSQDGNASYAPPVQPELQQGPLASAMSGIGGAIDQGALTQILRQLMMQQQMQGQRGFTTGGSLQGMQSTATNPRMPF